MLSVLVVTYAEKIGHKTAVSYQPSSETPDGSLLRSHGEIHHGQFILSVHANLKVYAIICYIIFYFFHNIKSFISLFLFSFFPYISLSFLPRKVTSFLSEIQTFHKVFIRHLQDIYKIFIRYFYR